MLSLFESIFMYMRNQVVRFSSTSLFSNDPENYCPLPFKSVLTNIDTKLDKVSSLQWALNCKYNPTQEIRVTKFFLHNKFNSKKPSIIFHHTVGERNYNKSMQFILGKNFLQNFNIFSIKAQYHDTKKNLLNNAFDSFLHQQQTFSGSVLAMEEIIKIHKSATTKPIFVIGASMGGIITSLHAFHFNTANMYFPLVSYPNAGEIALSNSYEHAVVGWQTKKNNQAYLKSFCIDPNKLKKLTNKIFPILGEKDSIILFDKATKFWKDFEVLSFPYGHLTPLIKSKEIQSYIKSKINKVILNPSSKSISKDF